MALGASDQGKCDSAHYARIPHLDLCFRTVSDFVAPAWGHSTGGSVQMHLEPYVDDLGQAHRQLEGLGVTTPKHQADLHTGLVVMLDPAGHPVCVFDQPG